MCDFEVPNWPLDPPKWDSESINILGEITSSSENTNISNLIQLSDKFPIKFPIESVRLKTLQSTVKQDILQRNIDSVYPVIHESALYLFAKFLLYKRENGTRIEKELYKDMTVAQLVDRLLKKRAVMFIGKFDSYILMDTSKGAGNWDTIGKNNEKNPLLLENCISYDEIKLSVFLSVSSYSYFINNGTRKNKGLVSNSRSAIEPEGIIIGLIGVRLKRINAMEFQEICITKTQNTEENGYGGKTNSLHNIFANFYQEPCLTYSEAIGKQKSDKTGRFELLQDEKLFDNVLYAKRLVLSFDTLLLEADYRAKRCGKLSYIHLVGIGLGVWKASDHQKDIFVATFMKRIELLGKRLNNVSDVDFAYFGAGISYTNYKDGHIIKIKDHPKKGIKIHVSKRDPHTKVELGKLLVVSYAWDGNALPGNEFWKGHLSSTGDSSTASSTQVAELHNPHINPKVCAANLQIVSVSSIRSNIMPLKDYILSMKHNDPQTKRKILKLETS